jgi:hypothetical protein
MDEDTGVDVDVGVDTGTIHVFVMSCRSVQRYNEALTMIKSLLLHRSAWRPLHLHLVLDRAGRDFFTSRIEPTTAQQQRQQEQQKQQKQQQWEQEQEQEQEHIQVQRNGQSQGQGQGQGQRQTQRQRKVQKRQFQLQKFREKYGVHATLAHGVVVSYYDFKVYMCT